MGLRADNRCIITGLSLSPNLHIKCFHLWKLKLQILSCTLFSDARFIVFCWKYYIVMAINSEGCVRCIVASWCMQCACDEICLAATCWGAMVMSHVQFLILIADCAMPYIKLCAVFFLPSVCLSWVLFFVFLYVDWH